jgi:G3E family GTPase
VSLPDTPLPVTIIGGYLGAGKTTLVNHLLRERAGRRLAVLVNDFGELSIDADLIESREDELIRLAGGCVCCSFGSDLVGALMALPAMQPRPDHVLIETSGVGIPGAVARTLGLLPGLVLDAIVVVADAETLRARAADRYVGDTVLRQLCDADLIVLNKSDLVDAGTAAGLRDWLASQVPRARVLEAAHARLPIEVVLGLGADAPPWPARRPTSADRPLTADGAAPADRAASAGSASLLAPAPIRSHAPALAEALFDSCALRFDHRVDCARLAKALCAPDLHLVRAKGVMLDGDGTPRSLQLVGSRAEVAAVTHRAPGDGRLVCIALRGELDPGRIEALVHDAAAKTG